MGGSMHFSSPLSDYNVQMFYCSSVGPLAWSVSVRSPYKCSATPFPFSMRCHANDATDDTKVEARYKTCLAFGTCVVCGCVRAVRVNSDEKSAKSDRAQRQGQPLLIRRARAITSSRALDTDVRTPRGSAWHCGRRGWDIALTCWHPRAYGSARLW